MNRITKGSFFLILFFILFAEANDLYSQTNKNKNLVQFSGMVLDGSDERLIPIPFTNVIVKGKQRGTFTDFKGFFSIVVEKGDIIIFSSVGYKTI
jgi:hypothetical protein